MCSQLSLPHLCTTYSTKCSGAGFIMTSKEFSFLPHSVILRFFPLIMTRFASHTQTQCNSSTWGEGEKETESFLSRSCSTFSLSWGNVKRERSQRLLVGWFGKGKEESCCKKSQRGGRNVQNQLCKVGRRRWVEKRRGGGWKRRRRNS